MANIIRFGGGGGASKKKLAISNLTEGTIVRIKEKGVEQDYYLAQHDYQASLNGSGRVLFVRKECHSSRQWNTTSVNTYATSAYDAWLNGEFKSLFDADVREAMGETMFPYTPGNGSNTVTNLSRSIFALSTTELGVSWSTFNVEGVATPIANILKIAQTDSGASYQLTRTPINNSTTNVALVDTVGNPAESVATGTYPARPAFTLPNTATVLPEANLDGSYTLSLGDDDPNKEYFKLTVVDGTTQPENPAENTIWVNTDVDMGMCYLAPNAPDNPEVGDVWVNTTNKYNSNGTNASTNLIRVNDNPYLEINVLNISQWDGSAWVTRENSAIYANGTWTNMALYLFNYGTMTEGYELKNCYYDNLSSAPATSYGSIAYEDDVCYLNYGTQARYYAYQFNKAIDFSKYTKMTANVKAALSKSNSYIIRIYLVVGSTTLAAGATWNNCKDKGEISNNYANNDAGTLALDLTNINESAYAGILIDNQSYSSVAGNVAVSYWAITA